MFCFWINIFAVIRNAITVFEILFRCLPMHFLQLLYILLLLTNISYMKFTFYSMQYAHRPQSSAVYRMELQFVILVSRILY